MAAAVSVGMTANVNDTTDPTLSRETLHSFWEDLMDDTPRAEIERMQARLQAHLAVNPHHMFANYLLGMTMGGLRRLPSEVLA